MSRWYDREVEQLEQDLSEGLITNDEFREAMRELNWALQSEAAERAQETYDDVMGHW